MGGQRETTPGLPKDLVALKSEPHLVMLHTFLYERCVQYLVS